MIEGIATEQDTVNLFTMAGIEILPGMFSNPPLHLPSEDGKSSWATELAYLRSPEQTRKIRWWRSPDPDPRPHNHPWRDEDGVSLTSYIISGGYTQDVYLMNENGDPQLLRTETFKAGDTNVLHYREYHVVRDIIQKSEECPAGTVTHFITGKMVNDNAWWYLNLETGELEPPVKSETYLERLKASNPIF